METFFLGCFAFGAIFSVASVLLGALPDGAGADLGDLSGLGKLGKLGKLSGPEAIGDAPSPLVAFLNLSSLVAMVTWFGAAGYLLTKVANWPLPMVLPTAFGAGVAGGGLIALFLAKVREGDRPMDPSDYRLEGNMGRITVAIPADGVGEVFFTLAGTHRAEAARGPRGVAVPHGTEVLIMGYERGIARVEPLAPLLAPERARQALPPQAETEC